METNQTADSTKTMDVAQSTSKPGDMLSPRPLKMSDLETSAHEGHQLPPRRLEPITNPVVAKKRKRAKKKDKAPTTAEEQTVATTDTASATQGSPTLLGESMLSRLRSRLDPLYNASPPPPPSESSSLPPMRLPPLEHSTRGPPLPTEDRGSEQASVQGDTSVQEGDHTDGSTSQKGSRRRTRRRKNDTQEASQSPGQPSGTQDVATTGEDVMSSQQEELKSTSREALIAGATGGSERKKRRRRERERSRRTSGRSFNEDTPDAGGEITAEVMGGGGLDSNVDDAPPQSNEDTGRQSRGRQLPAPPSFDAEDTLEPPISTMADELATTGGLPTTTRGEFVHPDDPQFLVSEEDIVEVGPDELQGTARLFQPVLQPHTSASQPKEVIFVERRDGRGFATQRKDAAPGRIEMERGTFSGEREISSLQFAIYSHKAIQHLAFIAHGLVAGISLWDCVVSNILSRGGSGLHLDLLTHYHPLTLPANAIYVFLLSIVILSLLDRFDFASLNRECLQGFFKTPVQIILLIASSLVFIALILTLSIAAIDERIALYPHQPSLWVDVLIPINTTTTSTPATPVPTTHTDTSLSLIYIPGSNLISSRVTPWLALAIVRAICCSVSWILVVWISDFDRLLDYLNSTEEENFDAPSTKN